MSSLRAAVIGTGFMGRVHLEAIRRVGTIEPYAVCGTSLDKARALADTYGVEKAVSGYERVIEDPSVDAVHICTPNDSHASIAAAALAANKHVICEKPLATKTEDAAKLVALARDRHRRNCTCHNLRYYPMVQHMRRMCEVGELGDILVVRGAYSQDWLLYDTDWNWRVDASKAGPSRAMADIGSHWCDMVEHITGQRIVSVCADLATFHKTRKRPDPLQRAISAVDVPVETEDFGAVVFRLGDRGRGAVTVSQVSAGRKNRLSVEISGTKAAVAWNQERPDELWIGSRNGPNQLLLKDPTLLQPAAVSYVDLPGGHSEGYDDTFKQVFRRFYRSIEDPGAAAEYPQFEDGLRQMRVLDAVRTSHQRRMWVDV